MDQEAVKTVRIVIDSSGARAGAADTNRALASIDDKVGGLSAGIDSAFTRIGAVLAAKFSIDAIKSAIDTFTAFGNALKVAGVEGEAAKVVQDRLFAAANKNGVEIGALSQLYSRASVAAGELGASQTKLLQFVDGVTASLRIQGGSTEQASGALLQLSQSLGSGIVRAEEFNSIMEGAFPIAQAAARGIDGMGGSVAKLRTAIVDGKVTSQQFFAGLLKGFGDTEKMAQSMSLTIGQSMTANQNAWIRLIGTIDKATGLSALFSEYMATSTKRIDEWTKSIENGSAEVKPFLDYIEGTKREIQLLGELFEKIDKFGNSTSIGDWLGGIVDSGKAAFADLLFGGVNFMASFVALFANLPEQFGRLFSDAVNSGLNSLSAGMVKINDYLADKAPWLGLSKGAVTPTNLPTGTASSAGYFANVVSAGQSAEANVRAAYSGTLTDQYGNTRDFAAERAWQQSGRQYSGLAGPQARGAASSRLTALDGAVPPAATPPQSKDGQSLAERIKKEIDSLKAAADAQDLMTAAARRGDVAFIEQESHVSALQKAIEIYGGKLDAADPKVRTLTASIEEQMKRAKEGKAAETFIVATTELEKQNVVLEAQNRLMNEAPEIQARELAIIKSKQEAQKAGNALTVEDVENRRKAIEQNELLKTQGEQLKQANELWTEPLRQGLRNIQTAGADAWETILQTGNFTFQSLGDVFTKTMRRMAAEFLALATIRPVMSMAVSLIGPSGLGLIGGNTVSQLGLSGGGSGVMGGGGLGSILGGGGMGGGFGSLTSLGSIAGLGSLFGGSSLSATLGSIGSFGSRAAGLFGLGSSAAAATYPNVGALIASGQTGASAAAGGSLFSAIPIWGWITAAATIAKGLTAGQPSKSLLGALNTALGPSLDEWQQNPAKSAYTVFNPLGPLGAAIGGLFGFDPFSNKPSVPPQPAMLYGSGQFRPTGTGTYSYTGDLLGGGTALTGTATTIATDLTKAFRSAGLNIVPSALIGGNIASGTDHVLSGNQWSDRPYTQTGLMLPGGGYEALTYNDSSMNTQQAGEYLLAQAFKANVLRGGVSGAGAGLTAGLDKINPTTKADLDNVIAMGTAYDALGKTTNTAKVAIDKIAASFDAMKDYATQAGLSLTPINDELAKQSKRSAQDFIDAMVDPLAVSLRALTDERESALTSAAYIRDTYKDIYVDMDKVATYYTNKEAALRDQFYSGGLASIQTAIDRLTYGDLANASPTLQLSGAKAAYTTGLARAQAGDGTSIANLASLAADYAKAQQQYSGSGPEYAAAQDRLLRELTDVKARLDPSTAAATPGTTLPISAADQANNAQIASLTAIARDLAAQVARLTDSQTDLTGQVRRLVSAGGR